MATVMDEASYNLSPYKTRNQHLLSTADVAHSARLLPKCKRRAGTIWAFFAFQLSMHLHWLERPAFLYLPHRSYRQMPGLCGTQTLKRRERMGGMGGRRKSSASSCEVLQSGSRSCICLEKAASCPAASPAATCRIVARLLRDCKLQLYAPSDKSNDCTCTGSLL